MKMRKWQILYVSLRKDVERFVMQRIEMMMVFSFSSGSSSSVLAVIEHRILIIFIVSDAAKYVGYVG